MSLSRDVLVKSAAETKVVDFEFAGDDLADGETLNGMQSGYPTVTPSGGSHLTLSSPLASGGTRGQLTIDDGKGPFTVSVDAATNELEASGHELSDDNMVHAIGCDLPKPLDESTQYYVRDVSGDRFKLSKCKGGTAIDLETSGSGAQIAIDYLVAFAVMTTTGQILETKVIVQCRD